MALQVNDEYGEVRRSNTRYSRGLRYRLGAFSRELLARFSAEPRDGFEREIAGDRPALHVADELYVALLAVEIPHVFDGTFDVTIHVVAEVRAVTDEWLDVTESDIRPPEHLEKRRRFVDRLESHRGEKFVSRLPGESGFTETLDDPLDSRDALLDLLPRRFFDEPPTNAVAHEPLIRVILAERQTKLRTRREHAIRLVDVFRGQVVEEHADVRFIASRHERGFAFEFEDGIDSRDKPLRRSFFVSRGSVHLTGEIQALDVLRLERSFELIRREKSYSTA